MKLFSVILLLTLLIGCHRKLQPEYSALVNYEYNYRTKEGKSHQFIIDFKEDQVIIDGIAHNLQFVGCNGRSCHWRNDLFSLRHYYKAGMVKVELEYEKEHVKGYTQFELYNVKQTNLDSSQHQPK